jgi:uncharacterized protein
MKVALYGATGRAGSRILQELVRRGHQVIAVQREARLRASSEGVTWVRGDLSQVSGTPEAICETIRGADAVVSAYAPPGDATDELIGVCQRLAEAVAQTGVARLVVVGGAGVLLVAPGVTLLESGKLPPEWAPIASSHAKALAALEQTPIHWTYLSPAAMFEPGKRTGHYRVAQDTLLTNEAGESRISMEDYAIALVDELEQKKHHHARFAVAW